MPLHRSRAALWFLLSLSPTIALAQSSAGPSEFDLLGHLRAATPVVPTSAQVTAKLATNSTLAVGITPGQDEFPGVDLRPVGAVWDLAKYTFVSARVTNTGKMSLKITLRVDDGDWTRNPWNAETAALAPGETGTITVHFGMSWGQPGYALRPQAVSRVLLVAVKTANEQSFRLDALRAGASAGNRPDTTTKPPGGVLCGPGVTVNLATQTQTTGGLSVTAEPAGGLRLTLPPSEAGQTFTLKPAAGRWDLRDASAVRVRLRNSGPAPLAVKLRLGSDRGPTNEIRVDLPAGEVTTHEIVLPFAAAVPWRGLVGSSDRTTYTGQDGTGTRFVSDRVAQLDIAVAGHATDGALALDSVIAESPSADLPDWLGQRPPVAGNWVKTFDENFTAAIDAKTWNTEGDNYWDKLSHFSHANTIIAGGTAVLRFSKSPGHQNDDPANPLQTDYATGYLDTFGKWSQKYGYFEARLKLPPAPGLWPGFWLMPDRGPAAGAVQHNTDRHGMEFDIMEHLSRWGPHRYNIAMHWDGYAKDHKQTGSDGIYASADREGFITAGLLWEPGLAVYYCNGREVLRWEEPRISDVPASILLTLPTGGWDNDALDDATLPSDFVIDYVRVWQRRG